MAMIDDLGAIRAGEPLRQKMRIAGELVGGERTLDVRNPYTGALVGHGAEGHGRGRAPRVRHRPGLQGRS